MDVCTLEICAKGKNRAIPTSYNKTLVQKCIEIRFYFICYKCTWKICLYFGWCAQSGERFKFQQDDSWDTSLVAKILIQVKGYLSEDTNFIGNRAFMALQTFMGNDNR